VKLRAFYPSPFLLRLAPKYALYAYPPFRSKGPQTDNQNMIRPQTYHQFEKEINAKYDELDESKVLGPHSKR
jgi:hypothetical protein